MKGFFKAQCVFPGIPGVMELARRQTPEILNSLFNVTKVLVGCNAPENYLPDLTLNQRSGSPATCARPRHTTYILLAQMVFSRVKRAKARRANMMQIKGGTEPNLAEPLQPKAKLGDFEERMTYG